MAEPADLGDVTGVRAGHPSDAPAIVTADGMWLEDLPVGTRFVSRTHEVTEREIVDFARVFDPQPFHVSPEAATTSFFSGLAASGWHTAAIAMRLLTEAFPIATGVIGGRAEVAWPTPTRPGDRLTLQVEVEDVTHSRSRPDRGTLAVRHRLLNQHGEVRQESLLRVLAWRRPIEV